MKPSITQIAFKLSPDLARRIDERVAELRDAEPGRACSRSDVIRLAIERDLDRVK